MEHRPEKWACRPRDRLGKCCKHRVNRAKGLDSEAVAALLKEQHHHLAKSGPANLSSLHFGWVSKGNCKKNSLPLLWGPGLPPLFEALGPVLGHTPFLLSTLLLGCPLSRTPPARCSSVGLTLYHPVAKPLWWNQKLRAQRLEFQAVVFCSCQVLLWGHFEGPELTLVESFKKESGSN